jgi:hypothetical protein
MKFCDSYTLSGNYATIEFQSEGWEKSMRCNLILQHR